MIRKSPLVPDYQAYGTVLGRLIGTGAETTGKVLGIKNTPSVKGQAFAAYDPKAVKGMGGTYATSAMGADHTAGPAARVEVDHTSAKVKAKLSRKLQKLLGLFTISGVGDNREMVLDLLNALYGWNYDMKWFDGMCAQVLKDEKRFNDLAGFNFAHHRLPEAFTERKSPGLETVFDVSEEDLASVFDYDQEDY